MAVHLCSHHTHRFCPSASQKQQSVQQCKSVLALCSRKPAHQQRIVVSRQQQEAYATTWVCHAAQPSSIAAPSSGQEDRYIMHSDAPVPVAGPVQVINSTGRGLGLGLKAPCEKGDMLMVSLPISLVYGSEQQPEDEGKQGVRGGVTLVAEAGNEQDVGIDDEEDYDFRFQALQELITTQKFSPSQASWLKLLASRASAAMSEPTGDTDAKPISLGALPSLCEDYTRPSNQMAGLPEPLASDSELLESLLQTHSFEANQEDEDMAMLAQQVPRQKLLGLWPEHALLNHSCTPSTVSYIHRGVLITRAARRIKAPGAELFTNYIGDLALAPLEVRQEALEDVWGFVCDCPRCKDEGELDKDLQQLVKDVYEACTDQINEDLAEAIEDGDEEALESLQEQLAAYVELIQAAINKKRLSERTAVWLQASLFCVYEALHHVLEERGSRDLGLTDKLQGLAAAIMPGSETHCYWARVHLAAVQEAHESGQLAAVSDSSNTPAARPAGGRGRGRGAASSNRAGGRGFGKGSSSGGALAGITLETADAAAYKALATRYGPISQSVYKKLLITHEEQTGEDVE